MRSNTPENQKIIAELSEQAKAIRDNSMSSEEYLLVRDLEHGNISREQYDRRIKLLKEDPDEYYRQQDLALEAFENALSRLKDSDKNNE